MAESAFTFPASEADFEEKVLKRSHEAPVLVDFWAPWCGPCRALAPILEKLVNQRGGEVLLAKVNIDDEQNLAMQYRVEGIPLVVAFRNGKPVDEFVGMLPEGQIVQFLDRISPSEADKLAKQALELENTEPAQAESLYQQALKMNATHDLSVVGLARLLLERNALEEAGQLLELVGPRGPQGAEVERLTAIHALRVPAANLGDEASLRQRQAEDPKNPQHLLNLGIVLAGHGKYPEALDLLLRAGEFDKKLAQGPVRETMVKIFHVIGVRSELADQYRDKLSSMLY